MAAQFLKGYALLIGVNESMVAQWSLPDVAKDIDALKQVLTHPERCAYPAENLKVITGENATRQGILDGLKWLKECLKIASSADTTAVIYYSGHGWRDEGSQPAGYYLIPYDVNDYSIKSSTLRAEDLNDAIAALNPQRLLVLLDCCHSGGIGVKGAGSIPAAYASAAIPVELVAGGQTAVSNVDGTKGLEGLVKGAGRAVLSSSQAEQNSYLRKDGKMSIFTYHLIEALTGHAQPLEGAAEVLVSDVMSHVYRRVPESAKVDCNQKQEPEFQVSGNFPVALLLGGKGLAKGQPAPDPLTPLELVQNTTITFNQERQAVQGDQYNTGQMSGVFFQPKVKAGVLQQFAGDMTINPGIDVGGLADLLKQFLPKNDRRPEQFRDVMNQFQIYHQTLKEWKDLHNYLDDIITAFDPFSAVIHCANVEKTIPSLNTLTTFWMKVSEQVDNLLGFARTVKIIGKPYDDAAGQLTGENWAVKISGARKQIDQKLGLEEASGREAPLDRSMDQFDRSKLMMGGTPNYWAGLPELSDDFNHKTYSEMHQADKKLRETATELYYLSTSVYGSAT